MSDILESVKAAEAEPEQAAAADRQKRAELWSEYRQILERHGSPQAGDAEKLAELVQELRLDSKHVELHIAVIDEVGRLENLANQKAAMAKQIDDGHKSHAKFSIESRERMRQMAVDLANLGDEFRRVCDANLVIPRLRHYFADLYGIDESLPPTFVGWSPKDVVGQAMEKLGIPRTRLGMDE